MVHQRKQVFRVQKEGAPFKDSQVGDEAPIVRLGNEIGGGMVEIGRACMLSPEPEPEHPDPRRPGIGNRLLDYLVGGFVKSWPCCPLNRPFGITVVQRLHECSKCGSIGLGQYALDRLLPDGLFCLPPGVIRFNGRMWIVQECGPHPLRDVQEPLSPTVTVSCGSSAQEGRDDRNGAGRGGAG
jgi:hypothetical protein